jgi:hypothetical protein
MRDVYVGNLLAEPSGQVRVHVDFHEEPHNVEVVVNVDGISVHGLDENGDEFSHYWNDWNNFLSE